MTIVMVGGGKGGTGKTTLATNLAALWASQGRAVKLVDTDSDSKSATFWGDERQATDLPQIKHEEKYGHDIAAALLALAQGVDYMVVDCHGGDSPEFRAALTVADVVVLPFQPSQADLITAEKMEVLVRKARRVSNPKLAALAVVTMASTHWADRETGKALAMLKDFQDFALAKTVVYQRLPYRRAFADGAGVMELHSKAPKAVAEIQALEAEITQILK